jgi:hypothetical protein
MIHPLPMQPGPTKVSPQNAINQLQQVNLELWERVSKLEFLLERELTKKSRDERMFKRKLIRQSQRLHLCFNSLI